MTTFRSRPELAIDLYEIVKEVTGEFSEHRIALDALMELIFDAQQPVETAR